MTSRELLRVGLIVVGVVAIMRALRSVPVYLSSFPSIPTQTTQILVTLLLGALPGVILIVKNEALARWWLPDVDSEQAGELPRNGLLTIGLFLLGLYVLIQGAAVLLSGALIHLLSGSDSMGPGSGFQWVFIGSSGVHIAGGLVLVLWARRVARGRGQDIL